MSGRSSQPRKTKVVIAGAADEDTAASGAEGVPPIECPVCHSKFRHRRACSKSPAYLFEYTEDLEHALIINAGLSAKFTEVFLNPNLCRGLLLFSCDKCVSLVSGAEANFTKHRSVCHVK